MISTIKTWISEHKKWVIAGVLLSVLWLPIVSCSHKPAPKAVPVVKVEAPYTVTKTDTKIAPVVKAKPKHRHAVKAPAPAPKCYFFLAEYNC